jgi:ribonuclease-3
LTKSVDELVKFLNYQFNDPALLEIALTHRSVGHHNNERLEYLGDAVLGFVIAEWLFLRFPEATEGELSRLRANLVNRESLAIVARTMDLGDYLKLGSGELKSGGYRRESILADAVEAILGAILLDSGFEECSACIHRLLSERLESTPVDAELKDPKTRLQEYLQGRKYEVPVYEVMSVKGRSHNQEFILACIVNALNLRTEGKGKSRRKAEQAAAQLMLAQLEDS